MKILKVIILSIVFFAAKQTMAQSNTILINNNTVETYSIQFDFSAPCPPTNMTAPGSSITLGSYCPGATLITANIIFTDNTCSTPMLAGVAIPYVTNPSNFKYIRCNGTVIDFNIHDNTAPQYILDIN